MLYCPIEAGFAQIFLLFMMFVGAMAGFLGFLNFGSLLITRKPPEPSKESVQRYIDCWDREMEKHERIRAKHNGAVIFLAGNDPCGCDPRMEYDYRLGSYKTSCEGIRNRISNVVLMIGSLGLLYGSLWMMFAVLPRLFTLGCFQVVG